MSKFTKRQRQELKSLVANAMIRRLDVFETQKYIQENLHVTISPDYIYHVKMQLKRDCSKELDVLHKDRDFTSSTHFLIG
jgi:CRISPR/Cas system endoribonuclease Cas6 (RAMP superfamily)